MKYKLLVLDMDGTLLNTDKRISAENRLWIRRAADAGVTVCMATGRGRGGIVPCLDELGLQTPFVAINGSEVWEDAMTLRSRTLMDNEAVKKLHRLAVERDTWYWAYGINGMYTKSNWISDINSENWMKFGFYTEDDRVLADLAKEISSWGNLEMSNSDPNNIELNPLGISKATGLRELCALAGCRMEEVVAVGDSLNDLAMIRAAGFGVAMGNAQDAVKSAADAVAPTNEQDGVAEVIRRYLLIE